jgi:hypothetical protein
VATVLFRVSGCVPAVFCTVKLTWLVVASGTVGESLSFLQPLKSATGATARSRSVERLLIFIKQKRKMSFGKTKIFGAFLCQLPEARARW